jgi:hypothetical protein
MTRHSVVAGLLMCLALSPALAQSEPAKIQGMNLAVGEGPYRFNDGGAREDGYIVRPPNAAASKLSPDTIVSFHVCNSTKVLPIAFGLLDSHAKPCQGEIPGVWAEWKLENGNLIAQGGGNPGKAVAIGELPAGWRSLLESNPSNRIKALSFPSMTGAETLAIIVKPPAPGGS